MLKMAKLEFENYKNLSLSCLHTREHAETNLFENRMTKSTILYWSEIVRFQATPTEQQGHCAVVT